MIDLHVPGSTRPTLEQYCLPRYLSMTVPVVQFCRYKNRIQNDAFSTDFGEVPKNCNLSSS